MTFLNIKLDIKAFEANPYFNLENPDLRFNEIMTKVFSELKKVTTHINNDKNYENTLATLKSMNVDFLNPIETNSKIKEIEDNNLKLSTASQKSTINWLLPVHLIVKLNSVFPLLIWPYQKSKINDIIFTNTYRFALIATVFPIFYTIQTLIIGYFFNAKIALTYLISSIILAII